MKAKISIRRGYPIVVVLFMQTCFALGTIKSFGVCIDELNANLNTTAANTGLALGLFSGLISFPAPLVALICRWRLCAQTPRAPIIGGATLAATGVIFSSMATSHAVFVFCLAAAGFGHCMLAISSSLALNEVVESADFNLLYGFAKCGYSIGMVLFPIIAEVLLEVYGWRGATLILGGMIAHLLPLGAAVKVKPRRRRRPSNKEIAPVNLKSVSGSFGKASGSLKKCTRNKNYDNLTADSCSKARGRSDHIDTTAGIVRHDSLCLMELKTELLCHLKSTSIRRNEGDKTKSVAKGSIIRPHLRDGAEESTSSDTLRSVSTHVDGTEITVDGEFVDEQSYVKVRSTTSTVSDSDIFQQGRDSSGSLACESLMPSESSTRGKTDTTHAEISVQTWRLTSTALHSKQTSSTWLGDMHCTLTGSIFFKDPCLGLVILTNVPFGVVYGGWHAFMLPRALEHSADALNVFSLTCVAAVAYFIGRASAGILSRKLCSSYRLFLILTVMNSAAIIVDVIVDKFQVLVAAMFLSALSISGRAVLAVLVAKERATNKHFHIILGFFEFSLGIGIILGGYLSGLVADRYGSFDDSFKMIAGVDALVFCLMIVTRCQRRAHIASAVCEER